MRRHLQFFTVLVLLTAGAHAELPAAQPLTSRLIHGKGDGQEQYLSVTAGPGLVTFRVAAVFRPELGDPRLDVEVLSETEGTLTEAVLRTTAQKELAKEALLNAVADLLDVEEQAKPASRVTKRKELSVDLIAEEPIVIRLLAGAGVSHYSVQLDGAVAIAEAVVEEPPATEEPATSEVVESEPPAADPAEVAPPAEPKPPLKIPGKKSSGGGTLKIPGKKAPVVQQQPPKPTTVKKIPGLVKKLQLF